MSALANYYTQPDPPVVDPQDDVQCPDDCTETTRCTICDAAMCADHSNEYATCADSWQILHHHECVDACGPCAASRAEDRWAS